MKRLTNFPASLLCAFALLVRHFCNRRESAIRLAAMTNRLTFQQPDL